MSKTKVLRVARSDAEFFYTEARRTARRHTVIITGARRAFESLPPAQREAFTIGDPMPDSDRVKLGLSLGDFNARGQRRVNRKRGAK